MTHLITRGEQQARKHYLPHIPIMPGELSNLDRLDRGMGAEDLGEPVKQNTISPAPFIFGAWVAGVVLTFAVVAGIVGAL